MKQIPGLTPISKKAFGITVYCRLSHKKYGITVDTVDDKQYNLIWAFPMTDNQTKNEHYSNTVHGRICNDDNFNGCPYCGADSQFICNCGAIQCYKGEKFVKCPNCGWKGKTVEGTEFTLGTNGGV